MRLVALLLALPATALAQGEVRLEVFVHDEGEPVPLASPDGLTLLVDETPARFEWDPDEPVSLLAVLDLSSSVSGARLAAATSGIAALFSELGERDRCALLSFAREVTLEAGWDGGCAEAAGIAAAVTGGGPAALNNALALALGLLADAPGRPVLVIFTDGVDGASWTRDSWPLVAAAGSSPLVFGVTAPAARGAGAVGGIYGTVSREDLENQILYEGRHLQDTGRDLRGLRNTDPFWAIQELAVRSGGDLLRTGGEPGEIESALAGVLDAARRRFSLRFSPPAGAAPGWYAVEVRTPAGEVRHRAGFTLPE